jgi:hypothetical protein
MGRSIHIKAEMAEILPTMFAPVQFLTLSAILNPSQQFARVKANTPRGIPPAIMANQAVAGCDNRTVICSPVRV